MLLVVDDDPLFLESAEQMLDDGRGVLFARNGPHARSLVETIGPTVGIVMIDLDLPGQDGFSLIREMSRDFPGLPLVAISGVVQNDVLESALVLGARATLRKPITPEWKTALARVRAEAARERRG